jgi:hypothetical protein
MLWHVMRADELRGDAELSVLAILRRCVEHDLGTGAGAAAVAEYIAEVRDRVPDEAGPHLIDSLVVVAITLVEQLATVSGVSEHGLIDQLTLSFHPDLGTFDGPTDDAAAGC